MHLKTTWFIRIFMLLIVTVQLSFAQFRGGIKWNADGTYYTKAKDGGIVKIDPKTEAETVLIKKEQLTVAGSTTAMRPQSYAFSNDNTKLLLFTHTAKVWRFNTRGDYWVLDIAANKLTQLGKSLSSQSLMFAKLSPDGKKCGYVSEHNLFVEDIDREFYLCE